MVTKGSIQGAVKGFGWGIAFALGTEGVLGFAAHPSYPREVTVAPPVLVFEEDGKVG